MSIDVLSEQGFGVLTEIDVRATLRQKLGEEIEDCVIFGLQAGLTARPVTRAPAVGEAPRWA